jgi:hypothetical protein
MTSHRKLGTAIILVTAIAASIGVGCGFSQHYVGRRPRGGRHRDRNCSGAWKVFERARRNQEELKSQPRERLDRS